MILRRELSFLWCCFWEVEPIILKIQNCKGRYWIEANKRNRICITPTRIRQTIQYICLPPLTVVCKDQAPARHVCIYLLFLKRSFYHWSHFFLVLVDPLDFLSVEYIDWQWWTTTISWYQSTWIGSNMLKLGYHGKENTITFIPNWKHFKHKYVHYYEIPILLCLVSEGNRSQQCKSY